MSRDEVVLQNKMQRRLRTINRNLFSKMRRDGRDQFFYSVTFEIDEKFQTNYHERLKEFIKEVQTKNLVIGGAMTDVKGDRRLHRTNKPIPICLFTSQIEPTKAFIFPARRRIKRAV